MDDTYELCVSIQATMVFLYQVYIILDGYHYKHMRFIKLIGLVNDKNRTIK